MEKTLKSPTFNRIVKEKYYELHGEELTDVSQYVQSVMRHVNSLTSLAMCYDTVTGNHQLDVSKIAFDVAREFGLSEFDMVGITMGTKVHDIGKIPLCRTLIQKPGRLTNDEYDIVKTHVQMGTNILLNNPTVWSLHLYPYRHHERLDGSGYPKGLKADELTLLDRIVHVSDVSDALLSDRSYRTPWSVDQLDEFFSENKHLYDSNVAESVVLLIKQQLK